MQIFNIHLLSDNEINIELTGIQAFWSRRYSIEVLYFTNQININEFRNSLVQTLQHFPFLFCKISKRSQNTYYYEANLESYVELEYEVSDFRIEETPPVRLLPTNTDVRMYKNTADINGLSVCGFKLTQLKNGFTLGFFINHAFMDQSSIVYFLKCLTTIYKGEKVEASKKAKLIDIESFLNVQDEFKNLAEIQKWAENIGIHEKVIQSNTSLQKSRSIKELFLAQNNIELLFDNEQIQQHKEKATTRISTNDIISAVSIKLYTQDPALQDEENFIFAFPSNMRNLAKLGEEAIGSLVSMNFIPLNVKDVRQASIIDLAIINRLKVNLINLNHYKKELSWFKQLIKFGHTQESYEFIKTSLTTQAGLLMQTNWVNFDYHDIYFNDSRLVKIISNVIPSHTKHNRISINVIGFSNIEQEKKISICLDVLEDKIKIFEDLALHTKLFSVKRNNF